MDWSIEFLDGDVKAALNALPLEMRSKFERISDLIEQYGLLAMREPYIKHLEGALWEMRLKGRDGIARAIYVTIKERRVVIVHVFRKKTQKTPRREIELALKRSKEVR